MQDHYKRFIFYTLVLFLSICSIWVVYDGNKKENATKRKSIQKDMVLTAGTVFNEECLRLTNGNVPGCMQVTFQYIDSLEKVVFGKEKSNLWKDSSQ